MQVFGVRKMEGKKLCQDMIPHDFFTLSDHFDFLRVTLKATFNDTQKTNGEAMQSRMKLVVNPWKGGRFIELNLRHDSLNCYGITGLLYRSNVIDIRAEDLAAFKAIIAKSFLCIAYYPVVGTTSS